MAVDVTSAEAGYPLRYDVQYPERLSRLLNGLYFIKYILAIPHLLILYALLAVAYVLLVIGFFAILFTTRFPRPLFDFVVNIYRWNANVTAYIALLRDEYPPFSWEPGQYPVTYEVDYPEKLARFAPLYKWILAIPHYIALFFVFIVAAILWFVAWLAIIFTGNIPQGIFNFLVGTLRWNYRVNAYVYFLRDEYPPFSMK